MRSGEAAMGCHGAIASGAIAAHPANITTRRVSGTRSGGRAAASASPPGSLAVGAEKYADVARRADAARFPRAAPVAAERSESVGTMRAMKGGLAAAIAAAALALNPALALAEDAPVASPLEQQAAPSPATADARAAETVVAPEPGAAATPKEPPSVPSGTYPLASSAPLPSELKKMEKDAAKEGSGKDGSKEAGKDSSGKEKDGKKQSKAARLEELNQLRLELDLKEIQVRENTQELVKQEQTSAIIQEELELARKLNAILQQELDRVKEETKLASGLCAQVGGF